MTTVFLLPTKRGVDNKPVLNAIREASKVSPLLLVFPKGHFEPVDNPPEPPPMAA